MGVHLRIRQWVQDRVSSGLFFDVDSLHVHSAYQTDSMGSMMMCPVS